MLRLATAVLLLAGLLTAPAHAQAAEPIPEGAAVDGFDGPPLGPGWTVLARDDSRWSLTEQPGALRVHALPGDTYQDTNTARNLFLMDIPAGDFEVVAAVRAPVTLDFQSAGILAWQDWDNHVRACSRWPRRTAPRSPPTSTTSRSRRRRDSRSCRRACSRSGTRARSGTCRPTPPARSVRARNLR